MIQRSFVPVLICGFDCRLRVAGAQHPPAEAIRLFAPLPSVPNKIEYTFRAAAASLANPRCRCCVAKNCFMLLSNALMNFEYVSAIIRSTFFFIPLAIKLMATAKPYTNPEQLRLMSNVLQIGANFSRSCKTHAEVGKK